MPEYLAPGVYLEESESGSTSISGVSTSTIDMELARAILAAVIPLVERAQPQWTRFNDNDPGITLIQLMAWLTEGLLYRSRPAAEPRRRAALRAAADLAAAAGACLPDGETLKRPRYFAGRLIDAATLQSEQDYHREMRRRHNLNLHGFGIVSGLEVHIDATTDSNGGRIVIEPGCAIDRHGEEIVIPAPVRLALPSAGDAAFVSLRHWDHPCAQSPSPAGNVDIGWIEDACLVAVAGDVAPPAVSVARLIRSQEHWTVDREFEPQRAGSA